MMNVKEFAEFVLTAMSDSYSKELKISVFALALESHAEAAVKKDRSTPRLDKHLNCLSEMAIKFQEGRKAAFEEARHIANYPPGGGHLMDVAKAIRALSERNEKECIHGELKTGLCNACSDADAKAGV